MRKQLRLQPMLLIALVSLPAAAAEPAASRIYLTAPAGKNWNLALPLGNGRIGAMVFGNVASERIALNEDTLVSGEPGSRDVKLDVTKDFDKVVAMLRAGKYAEADAHVTKHWLGRAQPCYQPLGDIILEVAGDGPVSNYRRQLDIADGIAKISYTRGDVRFAREVFVSHPHQVVVVRLAANRRGAISLKVRLQSPHPTAACRPAGDDGLVLTGQAPGLALRRKLDWVRKVGDQWKYPELFDKDGRLRPGASQVLYGKAVGGRGMFFEARLKVLAVGGRTSKLNGAVAVDGADEVVLLLSADTSYNGFDKSPSRHGVDPSRRARADLAAAAAKPYDTLRADHVRDFRSLTGRVALALGKPTDQSRLPTDRRLAAFANGRDPMFAALFFHFGRYVMISASRPGSQAANLQAIWNHQVIPPWASQYTTNINVECNYWPAEPLNLSDCHEPLLRLVRELAVNGRKVARDMYGRRGWTAHHNTSVWRGAQPVDNQARYSAWPLAGAWLCAHLWQHYLYTGDRKYLAREAYPLMKGAAEFCLDWLVDDGHGRLVTPVSTSPENTFIYTDDAGRKRQATVSMGTTMDMAIVRELFGNCIAAGETLGVDEAFGKTLRDRRDKLLGYRIGSRGQIQEWMHDFAEREPQHRHLSHLYGLHPGGEITPATPKLYAAARRSLDLRGDRASGWSMGWKINMWARLGDGDRAYRLLRNLLRPARMTAGRPTGSGLMPNMLASCPPFNIDANLSGPVGIAEMLVRARPGRIDLLGALPSAWPDGRIGGICTPGGFVVDLTWREGRLASAVVRSRLGGTCTVRCRGRKVSLKTRPGQTIRLDANLRAAPTP